MVKSSKTHLEEDEEANVYDGLPRRNTTSSAYKGEEMKVEAKSSEQKTNEHRSKHSETEQRRRSKINERFQILRGLIPQNDQKRDKASFLLEVIDYIQFLRDKLNMYEGSYQEPTKLMPWRNQNGLAESYMEHSQVLKNGSSHENSVVTPVMLTNAQNSMESDMGRDAVYKATDLAPGSASPMVPLNNVHAQPNMYALVGRGSMPTQSLQESISDAENMGYQHQSQFWRGRACATDCAILNSSLNEQDLSIESGSSSISSAFSQGVLNTLTQALQSSGVDLSQANISVQINVGKRVISGQTAMAVSSKDHDKQYQDNLVMTQTGVQSFDENSDRVHKRLRTE